MTGARAGQQVRNGRWRTALARAQAHHAQERSPRLTWRAARAWEHLLAAHELILDLDLAW